PRDRRPGPRRHRARQAGPHRPGRVRDHSAARPRPRRCRIRRSGRCHRDAQPLRAARLPHRRNRACDHQQPGRIHHSPRLGAVVAKSINAPIFHVNGDDPEAVVRAARLAFEYRQEFNRDVVIDLVCYRRRGHNEGDDPSMTQPTMYSLIEKKGSVRKLYTESLVGRKCITDDEAAEALKDYQSKLESAFAETKEAETGPYDGEAFNAPYEPSDIETFNDVETAISTETLQRIGEVFAE